MKIGDVDAALQRIQKEHGDLTCAEEAPLGFLEMRYLERKVVPPYWQCGLAGSLTAKRY